jgi:hypothetical protein
MSGHNVYLFQPQYGTVIGGNEQYWLPYSVGCLWAYAQQFPHIRESWNLGGIFFKRDPIKEICDRLESPKLCAFSIYVWNAAYCIELARSIKQRWPTCCIVVGGPQVSSSWTKYDFIDSIILNEGERCFVNVLDDISLGKKLKIFYKMPRMDDLNQTPSPYTTGVFDALVRDNPDFFWSTSLETNRGCPYSCTFCDWGGLISSKIKKFSLERVAADLDWIASHRVKTIFISDANFGIFAQRDLAVAEMVRICADRSDSNLEYISVTYSKHSTEDVFEIAKTLGPKHKGITFSVQSMNSDTLKSIKRKNMDVNDIQKLLALSKKYNVHHYTELILGLPLETKDSWKNGMCKILELGQHHRLEIWPNNVLENTEMHRDQLNMYQIKLINTYDIMPLSSKDRSGISEVFPTVCSTSTMSTQDMIESWLYGWLVIHFHINGYSQLLAKYCYHVKKINYRSFYDKMYDVVFQQDSCIGEEARKMQKIITNFYTLGHTDSQDVNAGDMLFHSSTHFYANIDHVINIALQVAANFDDIDPGVCEIQKRYIANDIWTVPYTVKTNVDIENWQSGSCEYQIAGPGNDLKVDKLVLFTLQRRNKKLFNTITKLAPQQGQIFKICTCGRSSTGFCTGLHALSDEEWDARVFDEAFVNEEKHKNEHKS